MLIANIISIHFSIS